MGNPGHMQAPPGNRYISRTAGVPSLQTRRAGNFIRPLATSKARQAPAILQQAIQTALVSRWSGPQPRSQPDVCSVQPTSTRNCPPPPQHRFQPLSHQPTPCRNTAGTPPFQPPPPITLDFTHLETGQCKNSLPQHIWRRACIKPSGCGQRVGHK